MLKACRPAAASVQQPAPARARAMLIYFRAPRGQGYRTELAGSRKIASRAISSRSRARAPRFDFPERQARFHFSRADVRSEDHPLAALMCRARARERRGWRSEGEFRFLRLV